MKFLILCLFALLASVSASKFFGSDPIQSQWAGDEEAGDGWGEEDWPSESFQPSFEPVKAWHEPVVLKHKVPYYVPVPVHHEHTVVKHFPVYIKPKPKLIYRKITHYHH